MELRQYLYILIRWLWLIVLAATVAGGAAFLITSRQQPIYRATARLLVINGSDAASDEYRSLVISERLASSYVERLKNYDVLSQTLERLGLAMSPEALAGATDVRLVNSTELIELSVRHTDPDIATALANEIPTVFSERNQAQQLERFASSKASLEEELQQLQRELSAAEDMVALETAELVTDQAALTQANNRLVSLRDTYTRILQSYENIRIAEASRLNNVLIDEHARAPRSPISPRVVSSTALAAIVGAMVAVGLAFLIEYLDDTIKSPADVEVATGLSPLGTVFRLNTSRPQDVLVVALQPRSPTAEAYRQIRTNIQFTSVDHQSRTILVTSANAGEGKSTTAANLATALAQTGKRVILVDADMRRPTLHQLLEVNGRKGLSHLISSGRLDPSLLQGTLIPNLRLLPAGRLPPNPAEFLGSERMKEVIAWLETQADHVIFDSPPLLAVTDGAIIARQVDTMLLVAAAGQTRFPTLEAAVKQVRALDCHISGVVMNKVSPRRNRYYYYRYYYHSYGADDQTDKPSWRRRLESFGITFFS